MRFVGMSDNLEELRVRYHEFVLDCEEEDEFTDEEDESKEEKDKNLILSQLEADDDTKKSKKKKWSKQCSLRQNLQSWLGFDLPSPSNTLHKSDYVVECGICYAHRLPTESGEEGSEGPIPDVMC
eukprot:14930211-Ditylum_brightwellii.AAC.1